MKFVISSLGVALLLGMFWRQSLAQEETLEGVFVNDGQTSEIIESAIETGIAKMNFITRPIARSRLKKTNPSYQRIDISRTADQISVQFDNGKPVLMPADGRSAKWTRADGEVFDVSGNWQGSQLVQTFAAGDGQRINTFSLAPDGKLTMQVTLSSTQLPAAVKYTLTFKRST